MHRTKVKVVEEALDANNTIARANRADFDRAGVTRRQLHERPRRRQDDAARARRRRPARRPRRRAGGRRPGVDGRRPPGQPARPGDPAEHRPGVRRRVPPGRQHGALGAADAAAGRDRPAGHRERRQPGLPGRVPGRRGRPGDGLVGHRGRGQAAQVPADVPHLRPRAGQQDRPAAAPRLRPRHVPVQPRPRASRASSGCWSAARTGEGIDAWRDWLVAAGDARSGRWPESRRAAMRSTRCSSAAHRGEPRVLRRACRAAGAPLPPDGRALRPRRPAGRARAARRRRAPTRATSRSSSCTR